MLQDILSGKYLRQMKRSSILILFMGMLSNNAMTAQNKPFNSIQWKIAAVLPATSGHAKAFGLAGAVCGIHQNALIIAGGANFPDAMPWLGGKKKYCHEVYVYEKINNQATLFSRTFTLPNPIAYAASCSTPKGIVYAGGENEQGITDKVVMLQWDPVVKNLVCKDLPSLPVPVTNAVATYYENSLYLAGGENELSSSDHFYKLDMKNTHLGWQPLPSIPKPVSHAVLAVQSDEKKSSIYLLGGRNKNTNGISDFHSSVYAFDVKEKIWVEKKSMPYNLCAGTGIAAGIGNILMFGGDKGETFYQVEKLIAAIATEKSIDKKQILTEQKSKLQSSHPGFSTEILKYNSTNDEWTIAGNIPFAVPVTTTALQWGDWIILPSGEIKAGVRTAQILSAQLYLK